MNSYIFKSIVKTHVVIDYNNRMFFLFKEIFPYV